MGGRGSKSAASLTTPTPVEDKDAAAVKLRVMSPTESGLDFATYKKFRDELLTFALGESAFDYAEQLFLKQPDNPEVMALLAETTVLYDQVKNKVSREHWCDRLDLLQRGVDVSRKCMKENPEYGPCYRTYVMCATRESEALYYLKSFQGLGLIQNYSSIMRRGERGMELLPEDAELPNTLAALCGRCTYRWYEPTRWYAKLFYGLPDAKTLRRQSIELSQRAVKNDPANLEYACRLAQAYFLAGDYENARRWYVRVRDEMPPQSLNDDRWQGLAHTQLSTAFSKSKWNVPFA